MAIDITQIIDSLSAISYKRILRFENTYDRVLSDLQKAEDRGQISEKQHKKAANEINQQFKAANRYLKALALLKRYLPILLIIEIGHLTLQDYQWSWMYEWISPGLNKFFSVLLIVLGLVYYIIKEFKLNYIKLNDYEARIISINARCIYGFL